TSAADVPLVQCAVCKCAPPSPAATPLATAFTRSISDGLPVVAGGGGAPSPPMMLGYCRDFFTTQRPTSVCAFIPRALVSARPAFVAAAITNVSRRHEQHDSAGGCLLDEPPDVVEVLFVRGCEVVVVGERNVACNVRRAGRVRGELVLDELDDERVDPSALAVV